MSGTETPGVERRLPRLTWITFGVIAIYLLVAYGEGGASTGPPLRRGGDGKAKAPLSAVGARRRG